MCPQKRMRRMREFVQHLRLLVRSQKVSFTLQVIEMSSN